MVDLCRTHPTDTRLLSTVSCTLGCLARGHALLKDQIREQRALHLLLDLVAPIALPQLQGTLAATVPSSSSSPPSTSSDCDCDSLLISAADPVPLTLTSSATASSLSSSPSFPPPLLASSPPSSFPIASTMPTTCDIVSSYTPLPTCDIVSSYTPLPPSPTTSYPIRFCSLPPIVVANACRAIGNLCFGHCANKDAFLQLCGAARVVYAMQTHHTHASVVRWAAHVITVTCWGRTPNEAQHLFAQCDAVPAILKGMRRHAHVATVQQFGASALSSLAFQHTDNQQLIGRAGSVSVLLRAIETRHTFSVLEESLRALATLCACPLVIDLLREEQAARLFAATLSDALSPSQFLATSSSSSSPSSSSSSSSSPLPSSLTLSSAPVLSSSAHLSAFVSPSPLTADLRESKTDATSPCETVHWAAVCLLALYEAETLRCRTAAAVSVQTPTLFAPHDVLGLLRQARERFPTHKRLARVVNRFANISSAADELCSHLHVS